jgi:hypothetical protein
MADDLCISSDQGKFETPYAKVGFGCYIRAVIGRV